MNWRHVAVAQILVSVVACGKPGQNSNTRIPDSLSGVAPAEPAAAPPNERPRDSTAAIAGVREYPTSSRKRMASKPMQTVPRPAERRQFLFGSLGETRPIPRFHSPNEKRFRTRHGSPLLLLRRLCCTWRGTRPARVQLDRVSICSRTSWRVECFLIKAMHVFRRDS